MSQSFVRHLTLPCLLLEWVAAPDERDEHGRIYEWVCDYVMCLPVTSWDCRLSDEHEGTSYIRVKMGSTGVSGGQGPDLGTKLDTPYRDGAHIIRDGRTLRLPCYVKYGNKIAALLDDHDYSFLPVPSVVEQITGESDV